MSKINKILVTGARGFCGRHLCAYLTEKQYQVIGTVLRSEMSEEQSPYTLIPLDVTNPQEIQEVLKKHQPEGIIHLAAQSVASSSWDLQAETFNINTQGVRNLLECIKEIRLKTRVLFVSSSQVYGSVFLKKPIVSESDEILPNNPYAVSKAIAEMLCQHYATHHGVELVIARSFNHFGSGQSSQFVFSSWAKQIAEAEIDANKTGMRVGNLQVKRDFLSVRDVVSAYEVLLEKGRIGEAYNVCSGNMIKLSSCLEYLCRASTRKINTAVDPARLRPNDISQMGGDPKKIKALNWSCQIPIEEALSNILEDWRLRVKNNE